MKASQVLAIVLTSLAVTGCVPHERPLMTGSASAGATRDETPVESRAIVAHLVDIHNETVGQMRVSAAPVQPRLDCN